jgi:hypothetical protein
VNERRKNNTLMLYIPIEFVKAFNYPGQLFDRKSGESNLLEVTIFIEAFV